MHVTAVVPGNWWTRLQKNVIDTYNELLADFTEEPVDVEGRDPDGDQLAVKQLVLVCLHLQPSLLCIVLLIILVVVLEQLCIALN